MEDNLYHFAPLECFASDEQKDTTEAVQLSQAAVQAVEFFGLQIVKAEYIDTPQLVRVDFALDFISSGKAASFCKKIENQLNIYLQRNGCRCFVNNGLTVELPKAQRHTVRMRQFLLAKYTNMQLPAVLGIDSNGEQLVIDLATAPHLLIAGQTGSGKSVCLNDILSAMLEMKQPADVNFVLIDPKMVELSAYAGIPHLAAPIATSPIEALQLLQWVVQEMQNRYAYLGRIGARSIEQASGAFPRLVVAIDELASLMQTSKKEVETLISRIAAEGRAAGIHLIVCTQHPSAKIITGAIKANIPTRIAFKAASNSDSRVILDTVGAEKLTGKGDGLFVTPNDTSVRRFQACYISPQEVDAVVYYAKSNIRRKESGNRFFSKIFKRNAKRVQA